MSYGSSASAAQRRIKVARVIARLNVGGPAIQACFLHQALRDRFHTLLAIGQLDAGEADMSYLLQSNDGVVTLPSLHRPVRLWSDLVSVVQLYGILRRERPDIVHTHTAKAGTVGRVAAFLARVPIVIHTYHGHIFRGDYFSPTQTRIYLAIERALARWTDRIVTVSESQAEELATEFRVADRTKIEVISNGYDLKPFSAAQDRDKLRREWKISPEQLLVVWAGRLVPVKNVELLAGVVRAARDNPVLRFVVVGDGTEKAKLQAAVKGCDNIQLVGWRSDMPAVWAAADIGLLTSRNEGTPSALVETMASARPFVSTSIGGVRDMMAGSPQQLSDGIQAFDNGVLSDSDPSKILRALVYLASNPGRSERMGSVGRAFALDRYSDERLAREISELYLRLANRLSSAHTAK